MSYPRHDSLKKVRGEGENNDFAFMELKNIKKFA